MEHSARTVPGGAGVAREPMEAGGGRLHLGPKAAWRGCYPLTLTLSPRGRGDQNSGSRALKLAVCWLAILGLLVASGPLAAQDDVPEVVLERLEEGDHHRQAGRLGAALESYLEARHLGPGVLEVYASLGALYAGGDDLEKALEAFESGLEIDGDDRQLRFNAAVVAMRLERFEAALEHVVRALASHRGDGDLHSLHGAILVRLERPKEALAALEIAAKRKPGDPQILFRLGNLHHQLGQKEQAVAAFRKAIKKDGTLLRAYYNLGAVLLEMGRFDQALDAYVTALAPLEQAFAAGQPVDAVHARAYQNLGAIHFQQEAWGRALDAYNKALKLDPALPVALYNQGFIQFRLGDLAAAERAYRKALELDSELPLAYSHLGQIHQRRGELEAAVKILTEGLPRQDAEARLDALRSLADCQARLGRGAEAERAYRAVLDAVPEDLPARLALGRALRRSGRAEEARRELEQVRRIAPGHAAAGLELAILARSQGRTDDERALYQTLLRDGGAGEELWPVRLNLALLLLREGEIAGARPHLEALLRQNKSDQRQKTGPGTEERKLIATMHGLLLALDGDPAAARKRLRGVLADDAGFTAAADVLAVLGALDDPEAAARALTESHDRLQGGKLEATARGNLGQALWLAGRSGDARGHLEAAATAYPRWLSVQAALGDVEFAEKRYGDAIVRLTAAGELCGAESSGTAPEGFFSTTVGGADDARLCDRLRLTLGLARVGSALERLGPALSGGGGLGAVRDLADRALAASLPPGPRATALFVRGTARLAQGADEAARRDLSQSLAGELPAALRPRASNNLGVALTRLGRTSEARAAYTAATGYAEATLNLGILLDDHAGDPRAALEHYRAYVKAGGGRREVAAWIERLERIYR